MKNVLNLKPIVYTLLLLLFVVCTEDDPIQYKLTTHVNPPEAGSISPSSGFFEEGTEITLTATPSAEYNFKNWSDGITGTENPITFVFNTHKNITAEFEKKNYSLNIEIVGEGTVTEEIIQAKPATDYPSGTIVKLNAVPSDEWEFLEWSGDYQGTENPLQITIDEPINLIAKFEKKNYSLNIEIVGEGTVTEEIIQAKPATDYPSGTIVKLNAVPSDEWEFLEWSGDYQGTENPLQITIDEPINLIAKFEKKNYSLNIVIVGEGTVTEEIIQAKPATDYPSGTIVKLTAIPSEGWEFDNWNGHYEGNENPLEITIDKPTSLTAKFVDTSPKTYISDDNFEQALIDLGYDDILDDYVDTYKIDKIIELSIISKNISDLTGIGDFIGLETLWCSQNQLTSLDVSANNSLTDLFCDNNKIVSLDLSNNTALTSLYCGNNFLNSLNVAYNKTLSSLHCEGNQFFLLDVSNNTALVGLNCEGNMLTELDVSSNTELIYLNFKNNQLTTLDISNNTNLTTLDCSSNQLTSLNISNNNLLGTIPFFSFLDCTNNQLDCIQVNEEQLADIGIDPPIYFWVKDDSAFYSLDCNPKTYVPDDNFEQALIDLGYDDILDDYLKTEIVEAITELNISSKNISELTGIEDFTSLEYFTCEDNQLTSLNLSANTELKQLYCNNNQLTSLDVSNSILVVLICTDNQLNCIQVSQTQLGLINAPPGPDHILWSTDEGVTNSLDCNY
ncbi:InlB B-repeat-containing protein [Lutibacter flavus]|uniref:Bacterial repeat domain-containing protein n=1 Tax=Lutibacter flavus TaxID=691689 RepID=A0A238VVK6_9FLAO|nr:hypothetical protein [Lutibacter flavus]SNR38382.1 hypothetical protein SAMN04488111_1098 [Lutibacter flavus]